MAIIRIGRGVDQSALSKIQKCIFFAAVNGQFPGFSSQIDQIE
jgi:hypothetical protein